MVTRRLSKDTKAWLRRFGKKIERIILEERGYSSLDAFSIEVDTIAKPTLYQICRGERDMKISTLLGLSEALEIPLEDLVIC